MPKGETHWNWQGGISIINDNRDSQAYKNWRQSVYQRDGYKCVQCGSKDKLNAHHIKSWKDYPALRYDIDNGITLCEKCHIKLHQQIGYTNFDESGQKDIISVL
jgi:5-methylcytosine-specific restriction endonuclease McrA